MTVQTAIRTLRDEGFVRSQGRQRRLRPRPGEPARPERGRAPAGGRGDVPVRDGPPEEPPRAGWLLLGIPQPETVAEHSFRVGIVGIVLAAMEGADVGRTAALCLLHDAHETRIGDVPSVGRAYVTTATPEAITAHQTVGHARRRGQGPSRTSPPSTRPARPRGAASARRRQDRDPAAGDRVRRRRATTPQAWRETSLAALRTDAGRQLAQAIGSADPHGWWSAFAASYPRAARQRAGPGAKRNLRGTRGHSEGLHVQALHLPGGPQVPKRRERRHGEYYTDRRILRSGGVRSWKRGSFATETAANALLQHADDLIRLARGDKQVEAKIGDLIWERTKRGGQLPPVDEVRRRLGLNKDPNDEGAIVGQWLDTGWPANPDQAGVHRARLRVPHPGAHQPGDGRPALERLNVGTWRRCSPRCPGQRGPGTGCWRRCGRR